MKKILSLAMIIAIIAGVSSGMSVTVSAKSVSTIVQVPLSYFDQDGDWRAASGNLASMPSVIQGSIDITKCESGTRVWGGDQSNPISAAKDADDSYLFYKTLPTVIAGDAYFELVTYKVPTADRVQLATGDSNIITVSMDIATTNVTSGSKKEFISSETNASPTSTSSNKWANNVNISNLDGKLGTVQCQPNTWYNVVFEIGGTSATAYKYYVDGVLAGSGSFAAGYLGLLRSGIKALANTVDDMAFDNYSLKVGEPYTIERYYADNTAKKLNFKQIKNQNTVKNEVTSNLNLISSLPDEVNGSTITWNSDKQNVISNDGIVTRGINDEAVKLTATITNSGKIDYKDFYVTVLQIENRPDTANDSDALTAETILGSNTSLDNITTNLTLPTVGASGNTSIAWTSSDESAVSTSGVVTRDVNHKTVTITATISKEGEITLTKDFILTVTADYNKVDKTALQALVTAGGNLAAQDYTAESYAEFENIYYEAMDIASSTGFTQNEVNAAKTNLEKAIAALVYANSEVVYSTGQVSKDTYVQKGLSGNPTATDLISKYPVTETSQTSARRTFVGFNIKDIAADSSKVYLKLYFTQLGSNATYQETVSIHSVGNGWTEEGLTWSNMPTDYSALPLATHGPENINAANTATAGNVRYIPFDVTDYVLQQKALGAEEISFAIGGSYSGSGYITVDSKEKTGGNPPLLEAEKYPTIENSIKDDLRDITIPSLITEAQTISLLATGAVNGHTIVWSSSNTNVIATNGLVTLPENEENVVLTAEINSDGLSYTKTYTVTVKTITTDELDYNALTFDVIKGLNAAETDIKYNLDLIGIGLNGTPILWTSSNERIITSNGLVVREALANAQDVTLTAAIGGFTKDFNLRVSGDVYVYDDCKTLNNVFEKSSDLTVTTEATWRITGIAHSANGKTNQYIVYKAAEGANFEVQTVVNGIGSYRAGFLISSDNVTYTPFTSVSESTSVRPIGEFGGYSYLNYNSTATLPAGTRYLKILIPNTDKAWRHSIVGVKITVPCDEIKFDDIKSNNYNGENITANLNLQTAFSDAAIAWTSDSQFILNDGTFIRPANDTNVKLTAAITKGNQVTTKIYNVVAKAYTSKVSVVDKPFVWFISETNKIAGVRIDSTFGGVRSDLTTNKMFASCEVVNMTDSNQNVVLVLVIYDELGKVIDVKYEKVTVSNSISSPQTISLETLLTADANYAKSRIKAFVWDNSYSPLINTPFDVTRIN